MPKTFLARFFQYLKERFPPLGHGVMIVAFTFSAISYSRLSSGLDTFVDAQKFIIAFINTFAFFFLLRVFDEHKDAEDDARFRRELPVPRGLITLSELRKVALIVVCTQLIVDSIYFPKMLIPWALVMLWMSLMGKEFFVSDWLKKHQFWYVVSHMFIIPFVDVFASGFDWYLDDRSAPTGLMFFFGVSFMNGIVIEVGRKLKAQEDEREGVVTYSGLMGYRKATALWIVVLSATLGLASAACYYAKYSLYNYAILIGFYLLGLFFAFRYMRQPERKPSKMMELISVVWTIVMYLTLGGIPMIIQILKG
ncbi:MAG: UbiA family prenyltransferase [Flavobacteriales bacterium]